MSIAVADNFQYKGGKPLDARMKFASVNDMTGTPAADLYDGCFAYVTGTKKYYSYDSSNTSDPTLGKWREFSAGAEYSDFTGATSQDAGAHGLVPAPTTADVDKYLKGDGSWGAISMPNFDYSNEFGAENIYDTQEKMIGQWTDGKPLYQKVFDFESDITVSDASWYVSSISATGYEVISLAVGISNLGAYFPLIATCDNSKIELLSCRSASVTFRKLILRYTKTTDSAMSIGTPNDYSTTEKIVGTWIDGKPIYQKTIVLENITLTGTNQSNVGDLSALNFDYIVVKNVNAVEKFYDSGSSYNETFSYTFGYLSCWVRNMASAINFGIKQSFDSRTATYDKIYITIQYTKTS